MTVKIAVRKDDQTWREFQPQYVSFADTDHAVIGMDFLIENQGLLSVDGKAKRFILVF